MAAGASTSDMVVSINRRIPLKALNVSRRFLLTDQTVLTSGAAVSIS